MQTEFVHVPLMEILLCQGLCELPAAVGSEVKKQHGIVTFYCGYRLIFFINNYNGFNKFVCTIIVIVFFNRRNRIFSILTYTINQSIIGEFSSFPTLVSIHGKVPTCDTGYFSIFVFQKRL